MDIKYITLYWCFWFFEGGKGEGGEEIFTSFSLVFNGLLKSYIFFPDTNIFFSLLVGTCFYVFLPIYLFRDLHNICVLREAHWDCFSSVPGRSHALYYIILYYIIIILYYIILYYIILYFNSSCRINSKDFLQFIFFRSPHRPKPKDFLQLILLIFYFEYPLKTWGNPFLPHTVHFINQNQRIFYNSFNWFFTLNIL